MSKRRADAVRAGLAATLLIGVLTSLPAWAEVRLPKVFGGHMVLQQDRPLPVWGWAQPGEAVTVQFRQERRETKANDRGEWRVDLSAVKAGGPFAVTVTGANTVTLDDVMVGEVWVCSGQSNMELGVKACLDADAEIAAADYPGIRLFMVPKKFSAVPESDVDAEWKVCTPTTIAEGGWGGFSAAAYYFGRELHKTLGVPVGLIDSSWGGTLIEPWTPPEGFAAVPALADLYQRVLLADPRSTEHKERLTQTVTALEDWIAAARKAMGDEQLVPALPAYPGELLPPANHQVSAVLYNAMIHPLLPFAIRGAIWYQGESNHNNGMLYTEKMKALLGGWRQVWNTGELPFYYVQIAPYLYGNENPRILTEFWEAQAAALAIPNTGMAVIHDVGDLNDIHPKNKQEVGRRLALLALAKTYGKTDLVCSGPAYKSLATEGSKLRVTFDNVGGGLTARDGKPLDWFEIIDADEGGFVKAQAEVDGPSLLLSAPEVKRPVAVRFAWDKTAAPNLMNKEGLPAVPFRAGDVPKRDNLVLNVPEANDFELVYDLDLAKLGGTPPYDVDNHETLKRPFDRIAYFVELQVNDDETRWVYVSMDAFTDDLGKIGVPTVASKAVFQQNVANMNVLSNVKQLVSGTGLTGGNIEFWPHNYSPGNGNGVPNASSQVYDFGDQYGAPEDGYGCMQVHNHDAKQTLFALNQWKGGPNADLGIGNQPTDQPDWTFARNAQTYPMKRLRGLVHCK